MQGDVTYAQERLVMIALYIVVYGALAFVLLRSGLVATISTLFFADSGNTVMLGGRLEYLVCARRSGQPAAAGAESRCGHSRQIRSVRRDLLRRRRSAAGLYTTSRIRHFR